MIKRKTRVAYDYFEVSRQFIGMGMPRTARAYERMYVETGFVNQTFISGGSSKIRSTAQETLRRMESLENLLPLPRVTEHMSVERMIDFLWSHYFHLIAVRNMMRKCGYTNFQIPRHVKQKVADVYRILHNAQQ